MNQLLHFEEMMQQESVPSSDSSLFANLLAIPIHFSSLLALLASRVGTASQNLKKNAGR